MKLCIIGLPQTGKKLLFELLAGSSVNADRQKTVTGVAEIRDTRFESLAAMYQPKKEARARIELSLLPGFETGGAEKDIFKDIDDADAICHVVRAFNDDSVYHVSGSVNPLRDIGNVNSELFLHDLIFIEKRMERITKDSKARSDKRLQEEEKLLSRFRLHLESDKPLRTLSLSDEETKLIAGYPFLTGKPVLIALNVNDASDAATEALAKTCEESMMDMISVPVKTEWEISQLESAEERREFMEDAGIAESALSILSSHVIKVLGLISFFTVGKDEVRQWLIRSGSFAPEAAGAIHSDIQRGFIRAEIMKYADLIEHGTEEGVKKAGKFHVAGKDYIVEDGDIINFRFNV
ncbi:MAG: YchF family ATPase [Leptospirales bacterium]|nr:YchF family ATPase [Leptospirales bacterium]